MNQMIRKQRVLWDVTLNHNLDGRLSKDALSQQLSALSRFDADYKCTQIQKAEKINHSTTNV